MIRCVVYQEMIRGLAASADCRSGTHHLKCPCPDEAREDKSPTKEKINLHPLNQRGGSEQ